MIYVCYFAFIEYVSSRKEHKKTAIWFISFNYRSSFKLTVTRLNNNDNMYPLPFFYLNWEIGRTGSILLVVPIMLYHRKLCMNA